MNCRNCGIPLAKGAANQCRLCWLSAHTGERSDGKRGITVLVPRDVYTELASIASTEGEYVTTITLWAIYEFLDNYALPA